MWPKRPLPKPASPARRSPGPLLSATLSARLTRNSASLFRTTPSGLPHPLVRRPLTLLAQPHLQEHQRRGQDEPESNQHQRNDLPHHAREHSGPRRPHHDQDRCGTKAEDASSPGHLDAPLKEASLTRPRPAAPDMGARHDASASRPAHDAPASRPAHDASASRPAHDAPAPPPAYHAPAPHPSIQRPSATPRPMMLPAGLPPALHAALPSAGPALSTVGRSLHAAPPPRDQRSRLSVGRCTRPRPRGTSPTPPAPPAADAAAPDAPAPPPPASGRPARCRVRSRPPGRSSGG